jgi:hypothetical protein
MEAQGGVDHALVGVLAKVLPTFANTTNTKIGRVLVVVLAVLAAANTANTANTRANTANTREPVVLALGAEHRARAVAARRRTAMRLAMRPAPAAADAARASRCRPTRHPATAPWPAAACRARQAAPLRIARRRPCIAKSLHDDAACERACARAGECAASAHRAVVRARLRRGGSAGKGGGRENAAQTRLPHAAAPHRARFACAASDDSSEGRTPYVS